VENTSSLSADTGSSGNKLETDGNLHFDQSHGRSAQAEQRANRPWQQLPIVRSLEMRAGFYQALLGYIKDVNDAHTDAAVLRSFKEELASILESFARVLRGGTAGSERGEGEEVIELRRELYEAKDRIIALLSEQSLDRAQIARLETRLNFLPDLQAQVDRTTTLLRQDESVHDELARMRFELNRVHLARMRSKLNRRRRHGSLWSRIRAHLAPRGAG